MRSYKPAPQGARWAGKVATMRLKDILREAWLRDGRSQRQLAKALDREHSALTSFFSGHYHQGRTVTTAAHIAWVLGYELRFSLVKHGDDVEVTPGSVAAEEGAPTEEEINNPLGA